jgi:hypothetical protein
MRLLRLGTAALFAVALTSSVGAAQHTVYIDGDTITMRGCVAPATAHLQMPFDAHRPPPPRRSECERHQSAWSLPATVEIRWPCGGLVQAAEADALLAPAGGRYAFYGRDVSVGAAFPASRSFQCMIALNPSV